jgi:hypothetical protein
MVASRSAAEYPFEELEGVQKEASDAQTLCAGGPAGCMTKCGREAFVAGAIPYRGVAEGNSALIYG